jgi:hypothetical protein
LRKIIKIVQMLTTSDFLQLEAKGIRPEIIEKQLDQFCKGFPYIRLLRPAIPDDGLISIDPERNRHLQDYFTKSRGNVRIAKFVPASGAATRMFKHLFEFLALADRDDPSLHAMLKDPGFNSVGTFFTNLSSFAFYPLLQESLSKDGIDPEQRATPKDYKTILDYLLTEKGLNYSALPKALLAFHRYGAGYRVAAEEHLVEASNYTVDANHNATIHFTISPEHVGKINERISTVKANLESRFNVHLDISHSIQKSSTDTLAVDEQNNPFRNPDGSLLFRPAGHGALIENLNELDADVVFIKNIDNVVPDHLKDPTYENKRLLGGYLLEIRDHIFDFLQNAATGKVSTADIDRMIKTAEANFNISIPEIVASGANDVKMDYLLQKLNRPIRVCGMVKNVGEPGGGPFWVQNDQGEPSLQIVESSQVNQKDQKQQHIFGSATHFNPVDLVCCIRDYTGMPFDLRRYVDESTGFISLKSSGGKNLKAMELPGLWNGAMADWITVFVEVPLITFNPVKTVNDLLRNEHQ